jgi:protein-S-isoprenylcysteine O-methyltransferase Ste14
MFKGLGVVCSAVSGYLGLLLYPHLNIRVLLGLSELAPDRYQSRLITTGLYARLRHPRYVQIALGSLGCALIANYLASYLIFALWLPGIYLIVVLEERELRQRFGEAYRTYCGQVPRFVPRFRGGSSLTGMA